MSCIPWHLIRLDYRRSWHWTAKDITRCAAEHRNICTIHRQSICCRSPQNVGIMIYLKSIQSWSIMRPTLWIFVERLISNIRSQVFQSMKWRALTPSWQDLKQVRCLTVLFHRKLMRHLPSPWTGYMVNPIPVKVVRAWNDWIRSGALRSNRLLPDDLV